MREPGHVHDPHGTIALVSAPGSERVMHRTSFSGARTHRNDPRVPWKRLLGCSSGMAVFCPYSPVFRLVLLQLSPEPTHSPDCLLRCSNAPPVRPVPRSKRPPTCISTTVVNPCTRVIHHIRSLRRLRWSCGTACADVAVMRLESSTHRLSFLQLLPEPAHSPNPPDHLKPPSPDACSDVAAT